MKLVLKYINKKGDEKKYKLDLSEGRDYELAKLLLQKELSDKKIKQLEAALDLNNFHKYKLKSIKLDGKKMTITEASKCINSFKVVDKCSELVTTSFRLLETVKKETGADVEKVAFKKIADEIANVLKTKHGIKTKSVKVTPDGRILISARK